MNIQQRLFWRAVIPATAFLAGLVVGMKCLPPEPKR